MFTELCMFVKTQDLFIVSRLDPRPHTTFCIKLFLYKIVQPHAVVCCLIAKKYFALPLHRGRGTKSVYNGC